ncbi:MAG: GNAT family N-acetyltransferase [bacterium]|nr:GNAT family N-acetyltransferase [bacterium]
MSRVSRSGRALPEVDLVVPSLRHEEAFLDAVARSRDLHARFVEPPTTSATYRLNIARQHEPRYELRLVVDRESGQLAGVVNANEIVRGAAQSAFLGYYVFAPFAGTGRMEAGLRAMLREAFGRLGLHRLEANIQPDNARSIALVERLGFRLEGLSPGYLRIRGHWRDHERWAMTREEFRAD